MSFDGINDVEYFHQVDLAKYTTIKLKKVGNVCIVRSTEALIEVKYKCAIDKIDIHMIGWGANQIIKDVQNKLFVKLDYPFDRSYLGEPRDIYELPSSVSLNVLQSHAQKFGLKGWEVITGIPASLGGAIVMNAGTSLGEICEIIKSVIVLRENNKIEEIIIENESFSYRSNNFLKKGDIVIGAKLFHHGIDEKISEKIKSYMQMRKETQPLKSFNCGCVFKNFSTDHRAGQFIDTLALKDFSYNSLRVSPTHANFVEHSGKATSEDCEYFLSKINDLLELHTGVKFELEVKIY